MEGFDLSLVDVRGIFALLFAALVGTFFGFLLSFHNIQKFGATAAVMTAYVIPVVAGIVGVLFLGERITGGMFVGILLIGCGVWIISMRQSPKASIV
jgi:drug/metabolite transporter (DMT)-like permease